MSGFHSSLPRVDVVMLCVSLVLLGLMFCGAVLLLYAKGKVRSIRQEVEAVDRRIEQARRESVALDMSLVSHRGSRNIKKMADRHLLGASFTRAGQIVSVDEFVSMLSA